MPDPLPADLAAAIAAAAGRLGPFARLQYHADVSSTNDVALSLAARGAPAGTSVLAEVQREGRGRRGRTWASPPGAGVYLSVLLRPEGDPAGLSLITLAAGVAAARAVRTATGLELELKWPNDLVTGRPWRKAGGVLCEAAGVAGGGVEAVVVGIGINVQPAAYPPEVERRATSLEAELSRAVDRSQLVVELLANLAAVTGRLWVGEGNVVLEEWRRLGRAGLGGARVRWNDHGVVRTGAAREVDSDGALVVESEGRSERLVAGEVTWERLVGE